MNEPFLTSMPSRRNIRLAVLRALSAVHWRRASDVARTTGLPFGRVRRCLHQLAGEMRVVGCTESGDAPFRLTPSGRIERRNLTPTRKRKGTRHG